MSLRDASVALRRFGLGAKPGDMARIAADPRGFVLAQCALTTAARLDDPELRPSHDVFAEAQTAQRQMQMAKQAEKLAAQQNAPMSAPSASPASPPPSRGNAPPKPMAGLVPGAPPPQRPEVKAGAIRRDAFNEELAARIERGVSTDAPFVERLVLFWSNHFCVSAAKGIVRGMAGGYEREAIRPHVLGRFADMLKAVVHHPAMLIYLDNHVSIGPNSPAGRRGQKGLNENLAREILELHTVGVDGGYGQDGVTNFARLLTGWSVGNLNQRVVPPGTFFYIPMRREPGAWAVLGKTYQGGEEAALAVLDDLARKPATARHIARKLARHFLDDAPPKPLTDRLEAAFRSSDGDLAEVAKVLVNSPEVWEARPRKVVPPYDFAVSLVRGFGYRPKPQELGRLAAALGQPTWTVPAPKGWPDDDDAWMGPAAIRERLRIAEQTARNVDKLSDPRTLAADLLGDAMSEETRQTIARAESREQGFELLVMAPEFLRR